MRKPPWAVEQYPDDKSLRERSDAAAYHRRAARGPNRRSASGGTRSGNRKSIRHEERRTESTRRQRWLVRPARDRGRRHSTSAAEIARAAQPCPLDTSFRRTSGGHARESGSGGRIRVSDRDTCLRRTAKRTSYVPRVFDRPIFDFAIETRSRDGIPMIRESGAAGKHGPRERVVHAHMVVERCS